ncbi:recombinase family protein [Saccharopolyspora sp. K220]|nr:recombinase family protein [Saccharopolyspora soli]
MRVRPKFEAALEACGEIKALAPHCRVILTVYEMKRLRGDSAELTALADHLTSHGIPLEMLAGPLTGIYDPSGTVRVLFAFFAAMAETERENIREATLEGLNAAARKGNHGGRPPVITEDMLHTVLRRRARGESVESIRKDLIIPTGKRKGDNPSLASIYRALAETQRQHDDLDPICVKVFEEKITGKLNVADRPGLQAALDYMRPGDMLTVQEADRLGRNLLEGLIVLNDLFEQSVAVKILEGIAAGEHTERNLILDLALALAEDRRRDIARKTRNGLESAVRHGRKGGRPRVVDDDKRRAILARRAEGQSLREIARGVGVSLAVVHGEVKAAETEAQQQP